MLIYSYIDKCKRIDYIKSIYTSLFIKQYNIRINLTCIINIVFIICYVFICYNLLYFLKNI